MRARHRFAGLMLCLLGCGPSPDAADSPTPPAVLAAMPVLEQRPFSLAEEDIANTHYFPAAVSARGEVAYRATDNEGPLFRIVDSTGRRLHAFGRSGDGPGEFRGPLQMQMRGDSLYIWDGRRMTMLYYTMEGKSIGEVKAPIVRLVAAWRGDSIDLLDTKRPGGTEVANLARFSVTGGVGRTVIPATDSGLQAVIGAIRARQRIVGILPYTVGTERIYLADPYAYRIYSYDTSGRPLAAFGRALPPHHRGSRELSETRAGLIRAQQPTMAPSGKRVDGLDFRNRLDTLAKETTPHFYRTPLHIDGRGRLWVIGTTNDSTTIDVFADTLFLGRKVLPCYLFRAGTPVTLAEGWLLLECALPESSDLPSELQLYRILDAREPANP